MPSYPSPHQIEEIFQDGEAGPQVLRGIIEYFDPKVQLVVVGHEHHMSGSNHAKDDFFGAFHEMLDFSQPSRLDVIRVIGGGDSPWACVECFAHGKSKAGKKFHHEFCWVVRFSPAGKIVKLRCYYDSAHMDDHVNHHRENKDKAADANAAAT
ncbi:MAG: hypothetical protein Q9182_007294 [Xanthomendoza sp. 2 TL-2023]